MLRLPIEEDYRVLLLFFEKFEAAYEEIERLAMHLEKNNDDVESVVKIDALLGELLLSAISSNLAPMVEPLEILTGIIKNIAEFKTYTASFSEPLMLLMDRFLLMARQAVDIQSVDFTIIQEVQNAITPLAHVDSLEEMQQAIPKTTHVLLGHFDEKALPGVELFSDDTFVVEHEEPAAESDEQTRDNTLLQILGETIDHRHRFWKSRSQFILHIAIGMNALTNNVIHIDQLEAAVYLHDFPMVRLSDEILYKKKLDKYEFEQIKEHTAQAYEMALAAKGLEACAQIVYQHHERPDGSGYPEGIEDAGICDGAKILSICDAFHAMTHNTPYKARHRSIIRAIAEINACRGTQFASPWVDRFNIIVRTQRLAKAF